MHQATPLPSEPSAEARPTIAVSLILTVLNEAASIDELCQALADQTVWPREIIIVDGGSTDATRARLERWQAHLPLRVLVVPGCTISAGRNHGIAAAANEVIVVTDAGTRPASGWLGAIAARLVDQADGPPRPSVVGGWFVADPRGIFEMAMGATVLPDLNEIEPTTFLPSSRSVAFSRAAWRAAGGYPEWLDYCEDLVFDLALKAASERLVFVPAALVRFRPRASLRAFWHQYFRYARGDGKAGLWPRRHLIRYCTYVAVALVMLASGNQGRPGLAVAGLLLLPGGIAYLWPPYARLVPRLGACSWTERLSAIAWVPVIRLVGDLAKMAGYPVGLLWRARRYGLQATWQTIGSGRADSRGKAPVN